MSLLCRACLVAKESFTYVLFENVSAEVYTFCTAVEVHHYDELPKTICNTCHELLEKLSNFKSTCIQSQNTLMFQNNFNKTLPNVSSTNDADVNFEINESCEVVMSEVKLHNDSNNEVDLNNDYYDSSNGDEDGNNDNECYENDPDDDHDNENYNNDQGTPQIEDCSDNDDDDDDEPLQEIKKKIKCTISDFDESIQLDLPKICKKSIIASYNVLPEKSKTNYLGVYKRFIAWKNKTKATSFSENVMMTYFKELAGKFKPSTLWSTYSMLRSTMVNEHDVDIKRYTKIFAFLKRQSEGFTSRKPKELTLYDIQRFVNEAPDDPYLPTKVALIFGLVGACKPCSSVELPKVSVKDVEIHGEVILIKIPNKKDKISKVFTVQGQYYEIVKKYHSHVSKSKNDRFFQHYQKSIRPGQAIGLNRIKTMPKEIAKFLGLPDPEDYTGRSFKKIGIFNNAKTLASHRNLIKQPADLKRSQTPSSPCPSASGVPEPKEKMLTTISCEPKEVEKMAQVFIVADPPKEESEIMSRAPKQETEIMLCVPKQEPDIMSCVQKHEPDQMFMSTASEQEPNQMCISTLHVPKQEPEPIEEMDMSSQEQELEEMSMSTYAPKQKPEPIFIFKSRLLKQALTRTQHTILDKKE